MPPCGQLQNSAAADSAGNGRAGAGAVASAGDGRAGRSLESSGLSLAGRRFAQSHNRDHSPPRTPTIAANRGLRALPETIRERIVLQRKRATWMVARLLDIAAAEAATLDTGEPVSALAILR